MPRGGDRPGSGRPPRRLTITLDKDVYSDLTEFSRVLGMTPEQVAANLITAHMETRKSPIPTPQQAKLN